MTTAYVVLCEADRERLGAPERLPYELLDITAREQATLQQAFGYHDPNAILEALDATVDREKRRLIRDPSVFLALVWLGLRQAGLLAAKRADEMAAELAGLDFKIARANLDFDVPAEAEGKGEGSTPTETSTS